MGFFEKHNLNADIIFIRGGAMGKAGQRGFYRNCFEK
jgi:hypothetical protein